MIDVVRRTAARHRMFARGERVGAAVSGGPDSSALLLVLRELAAELDLRLAVVHVNHGLRGAASDADESHVRELAGRLGLPLHLRREEGARLVGLPGTNLEEAGREARYGFFRSLIEQGSLDKVATGHTRSDQAETALFRLLRGSGPAGLAGIRPVLRWGGVRPLIGVSRREVLAYLDSRGAAWREDSSNFDLARSRNRIRHELLPALERAWNPRIEETLARTASLAGRDEDFWEARTAELARRVFRHRPDGGLLTDVSALQQLHPAETGRLFRNVAPSLEFAHVEALLEVAARPSGSGSLALPGLRVTRSCGQMLFEPAGLAASDPPAPAPVEPPATLPSPDGRGAIEFRLLGQGASLDGYNEAHWTFVDWSKMPKPLRLRVWRPGDRLSVPGRSGTSKLKKLFQQSRVAVWDRVRWPVAAADGPRGERVVWAGGFGGSEEFAAGPSAKRVLAIGWAGQELR